MIKVPYILIGSKKIFPIGAGSAGKVFRLIPEGYGVKGGRIIQEKQQPVGIRVKILLYRYNRFIFTGF